MSAKLSNGFLRHLGLEAPPDTPSSGNTRKRKFPQTRKDQRQAERDSKRTKQRGSFQTRKEPQPSSHLNRNTTAKPIQNNRNNTTVPTVRPHKNVQHPQRGQTKDDRPKKAEKASSQSKSKGKSKGSNELGLPWSDDDSIHSSDFDSGPEQPAPKKRQKSTKEIEKEKKLTKTERANLELDDKEISRLERKLGIKKDRKSLPKAFKEDGLADLLGESGGGGSADEGGAGLGDEEREWLRQKRRKALRKQQDNDEDDDDSEDEEDMDGLPGWNDDDDSEAFGEEGDSDGTSLGGDDDDNDEGFDEDSEFGGFDTDERGSEHEKSAKKRRENPYLPPTTGRVETEEEPTSGKYVPPHLRHLLTNDDTSQLQKQVKSIINKVTQATINPCLNDLDRIYRSNARQIVTEAVVNQLLIASSERAQLVDAFTVDLAGFSAAIFKLVGTDFVAHLVRRSYEMFGDHYQKSGEYVGGMAEGEEAVRNKETNNLISLTSALYSLDVVGPRLVYDYIRFLLNPENFAERNTDLLMRVIQVCGPKLRKDDPVSLKGIAGMVKPAVERLGASNLSFRTKFVIDNINDLVNNRPKAVNRYAISSERIVSMKKTIGSIKTSGTRSTEPLNLGFEDLEKAGTKGMWWRVGARWDGNTKGDEKQSDRNGEGDDEDDEDAISLPSTDSDLDSEPDLLQAAQAQGMNTEVRRSIFAAVMTGLDADDGFRRLTALRLNSNRQKEIPQVLVQCVGAEKEYNMYYALLSRRFCVGHQMQYAFQAALWQVFRRLGEGLFDEAPDQDFDEDEDEEEDRDGRGGMGTARGRKWDESRIANTARLFGVLISEGLLSLKTLRVVDILRVGESAKEFLTLMMVAVLIPLPEKSDRVFRKLRKGKKKGEVEVVEKVFEKVSGEDSSPVLVAGLMELLKRAKRFEGMGKKDMVVLKWGVGVARDTLRRKD